MYPFDGRIYNSFAAVCQKDTDMEDGVLQTAYYLMRALACDIPHEAAQESLIAYFEQLRSRFNNWKKVNKVKRRNIPADERLTGFLLAFFRVQGILYTRVGIDELDELFEL